MPSGHRLGPTLPFAFRQALTYGALWWRMLREDCLSAGRRHLRALSALQGPLRSFAAARRQRPCCARSITTAPMPPAGTDSWFMQRPRAPYPLRPSQTPPSTCPSPRPHAMPSRSIRLCLRMKAGRQCGCWTHPPGRQRIVMHGCVESRRGLGLVLFLLRTGARAALYFVRKRWQFPRHSFNRIHPRIQDCERIFCDHTPFKCKHPVMQFARGVFGEGFRVNDGERGRKPCHDFSIHRPLVALGSSRNHVSHPVREAHHVLISGFRRVGGAVFSHNPF